MIEQMEDRASVVIWTTLSQNFSRTRSAEWLSGKGSFSGHPQKCPETPIIADALRFLGSKAGGIDQLPFDPFAAIERLRARVLPELPEGWQIQAMDDDIWLLRARENPPRCWEVFGAGVMFAGQFQMPWRRSALTVFRSMTRRTVVSQFERR